MRTAALLFVVACFGLVNVGAAQSAGEPARRQLLEAEVLASSERFYPLILESIASVRAAAGEVRASEGAFDLVFSADGFSRVDGFYDGTAIEGRATQRFRPLGASVYGGYKLSDGTFPIYEDEYYTNTGGTLSVGVLFALLRDNQVDDLRFAEQDSLLALEQAKFDVLLTKIGVQERALIAYWRWVAAGRRLQIYEDLARIAVERQDGLEEQIRRGAVAQILLTENLQNITRRQILVTAAKRDLQKAANDLSLYYRDRNGLPRVPVADQLPLKPAPVSEIYRLATPDASAMSDALARRPELAIVRTAIEREQNRIALAENADKPQLDFGVEVQQGLGNVAEGGPSRDSTDTKVGFTFSVPLQRNTARGELDRSRAELEKRQYQQQLREEQVGLEIRNIVLDLSVSRELLLLAEQDVQQSELMRESELRRVESGASDFFRLNIREETAADARVRYIQAEFNTRVARVNYDAATVNLGRLGITSAPFTQ
jgi:outer membrane protein TolC